MENLFHLFQSDVGIGRALGYSALGFAIVFLMLIVLLAVIKIMVAVLNRKKQPVQAAQPAEQPVGTPAPGSAGHVKLFDVPDATAAMLMAIVADKMQKPLNELRFISIKEVK